jgi:AhpD family alkylhydroperoxidase
LHLGKVGRADDRAMAQIPEMRAPMTSRLNPYKAAPKAMKALVALENYVQQSGLDHSLIDLVETRASQINGCAYCIHMHTSEARTRGETEAVTLVSETELVNLTPCVAVINAWNRIAISFRAVHPTHWKGGT